MINYYHWIWWLFQNT